jgi:hypothetical protein
LPGLTPFTGDLVEVVVNKLVAKDIAGERSARMAKATGLQV